MTIPVKISIEAGEDAIRIIKVAAEGINKTEFKAGTKQLELIDAEVEKTLATTLKSGTQGNDLKLAEANYGVAKESIKEATAELARRLAHRGRIYKFFDSLPLNMGKLLTTPYDFFRDGMSRGTAMFAGVALAGSTLLVGEALTTGWEIVGTWKQLWILNPIQSSQRGQIEDAQDRKGMEDFYARHPDRDPRLHPELRQPGGGRTSPQTPQQRNTPDPQSLPQTTNGASPSQQASPAPTQVGGAGYSGTLSIVPGTTFVAMSAVQFQAATTSNDPRDIGSLEWKTKFLNNATPVPEGTNYRVYLRDVKDPNSYIKLDGPPAAVFVTYDTPDGSQKFGIIPETKHLEAAAKKRASNDLPSPPPGSGAGTGGGSEPPRQLVANDPGNSGPSAENNNGQIAARRALAARELPPQMPDPRGESDLKKVAEAPLSLPSTVQQAGGGGIVAVPIVASAIWGIRDVNKFSKVDKIIQITEHAKLAKSAKFGMAFQAVLGAVAEGGMEKLKNNDADWVTIGKASLRGAANGLVSGTGDGFKDLRDPNRDFCAKALDVADTATGAIAVGAFVVGCFFPPAMLVSGAFELGNLAINFVGRDAAHWVGLTKEEGTIQSVVELGKELHKSGLIGDLWNSTSSAVTNWAGRTFAEPVRAMARNNMATPAPSFG